MPVYNGEVYLRDAIESILNQTLSDFEFIISDNASTDGTEEICREFARKDGRIQYVRNSENIGAAKNYNHVFDLSNGQYFRWANADDLFEHTLHQRCFEVLSTNPSAVLAYGMTEIIDESGKTTRFYNDNLDLQQPRASDRFLRFFRQVGLTNVIYGLMRADAMRKTNLFGDGTIPAADIKFMAELTLQGTFIEIPDILFYRRMHANASSFDRKDSERQQVFWMGNVGGFRMPLSRTYVSYARSVAAAPMCVLEKFRLWYYIVKWSLWNSPKIVSEIFDYVRRRSRKSQ